MEIDFVGQLDKTTLRRAVALANRPKPWQAAVRWGSLVVFAGLYAALAFGLAQQDERSSWELARVVRHLVALLALVYVALRPLLSTYTVTNRLWSDPVMREPDVGKATGDGITYFHASSQRTTPWQEFARVRRAKDMVVLLTAAGALYLFPRSFFQSDDDWGAFQRLCESKIVEAR